MAPRTRKPTGRVPWPLVLVEGAEKSGKSWAAAELSASPRVGPTYWIDLGEGAADEYGAIPGARYEVIDHNGSWADILGQVQEVHGEAVRAAQASEPPVVLVIDSMTAEWDLLKGVADQRARDRLKKKGRAVPADAEPQISMDLWNDVNSRHRKLMTLLMTMPGIVVMTARGKEVAAMDAAGRPVEGRKDYKVEGHKNLAFDASAWVRLSRDTAPQVIGVRSVHAGVRPGVDRPVAAPSFSLEWLIFDVLKCDPAAAHVRDLATAEPERTADEIAAEALLDTTGVDRLRALHHEATAIGVIDSPVSDGQGNEGPLRSLIGLLGRTRAAQGPAADKAHRHMHALWRKTPLDGDRDGRLQFTSEIVGRPVESSKDLTAAEADAVIARLSAWVEELDAQAGAEPAGEAP